MHSEVGRRFNRGGTCLRWRTVAREITREANMSCMRRVLDIILRTLHFIQRQ